MANQPADRVLDADTPGPVEQQVADVDERGRLKLPARVIAPLAWLKPMVLPTEVLVVLAEPLRAAIYAWKPLGEVIVQRRKQLISKAEDSNVATAALYALEDRYQKIPISEELRPTLSPEIMAHLHLSKGISRLYVVRIFDRIELLALAYRDTRIAERAELISDLP